MVSNIDFDLKQTALYTIVLVTAARVIVANCDNTSLCVKCHAGAVMSTRGNYLEYRVPQEKTHNNINVMFQTGWVAHRHLAVQLYVTG